MNARTLPTPIVSATRLRELLERAEIRLLDCRWYLDPKKCGIEAYRRGHLPGAYFVDLDRDLSGPVTPRSGRHPWPDPIRTAEVFSGLGIAGGETPVVCYDDAGGAVAARCWFVLRWLGHEPVSVLDGGIDQWRALHLGVTAEPTPPPVPRRFVPDPHPAWLVDKQAAGAIGRGSRNARLVDARAPERYRGESEPVDPRPGHIPGATNLPFTENLTDEKTFRTPRELRKRIGDVASGSAALISYCGSGVTACNNLLAWEIAGVKRYRLYPGSWSEWARDPSRPAATEPATSEK